VQTLNHAQSINQPPFPYRPYASSPPSYFSGFTSSFLYTCLILNIFHRISTFFSHILPHAFVVLLAQRHRLDCLHFVTVPSLAWAMALKHTDAKLDLITDSDIYLTIEGGIRGHHQARSEGGSTGSIEAPSAASSTLYICNCCGRRCKSPNISVKMQLNFHQNEPFQVRKSPKIFWGGVTAPQNPPS